MRTRERAISFAAALALLTGCAGVTEWANAPPSNRLANGRCRNPNDATTTIECEQKPPPTAVQASQRNDASAAPSESARDASADGRTEVLRKLHAGLEADAAQRFWDLPQEARTTAFAAEISAARVERIRAAGPTPSAIAKQVAGFKPGVLPGDSEVLSVLAERVPALAKAAPSTANIQAAAQVSRLCAERGVQRPDLSAMEEMYGPLLTTSLYSDEKAQGAFLDLFPDSRFNGELTQMQAQEAAQNRNREFLEQEQANLDDLWSNVVQQGDALAQLSYKIAFAQKQFDPRRARRGIQNMHLHHEMLVKDGFCPARKEFVKAAGQGAFTKRAAEHCKGEPPTESGVPGVGVTLTNECRSAFASGC